ILALRDHFLHDAGAYTPYGIIVPLITSTQLPGPYRLRHYAVEFEVRYTNKVMVTPYRGAGRPHGAFVMERMIGRIARELHLEPRGGVYVATGLTTQGQGHQTTFAQIAAGALGCDPRDVTVVTGDTSRFNWGAGTFASRALVTAGNAVASAAGKVRDKAVRLAAELLEVAPDDLEVRDGAVSVKGLPDRRLAL